MNSSHAALAVACPPSARRAGISIIAAAVVLIHGGGALAQYPTSQEWNLNDPDRTRPDSSSNPMGQEGTLRRDGGMHGEDPYGGTTRQGWSLFGSDSLNFLIPNKADSMRRKVLMAQVTFSIQGNPIVPPMLSASDLNSNAFMRTQSNTRQTTDPSVFVNETTWTITPCPPTEQFIVQAPEGRSMFIDNVLITTDCVEIPEPAGALSIGAALACGLGRFLRNSI
jgi:hypothetical protein